MKKDGSKREWIRGRDVLSQMDQRQWKQSLILSVHQEWKPCLLLHHCDMKQRWGWCRYCGSTPHKCWNCCVALLTSLEMAKCAKMQMHPAGNFSLSLFSIDNVDMRSAKGFRGEEPARRGNCFSLINTGVTGQTVTGQVLVKKNTNTKPFGEKSKWNWKGNLISSTSCHFYSAGKSSMRNCSTFCFHYILDWQGKWNHRFSCKRDTPVTSATVSDGRKVENLSWTGISGPNQWWLNPRVVSLGLLKG